MQIGDHAAAEPRAQPVFQAREIGGRLVGRDHDLLAGIDQRIEGMEELFLRVVLADQELQVVDHQHVDAAQVVLELDRGLVADRGDEVVHEFFGRHVGDRNGLRAGASPVCNFQAMACIRCVLPSPTPPYRNSGLKPGEEGWSATRRAQAKANSFGLPTTKVSKVKRGSRTMPSPRPSLLSSRPSAVAESVVAGASAEAGVSVPGIGAELEIGVAKGWAA